MIFCYATYNWAANTMIYSSRGSMKTEPLPPDQPKTLRRHGGWKEVCVVAMRTS